MVRVSAAVRERAKEDAGVQGSSPQTDFYFLISSTQVRLKGIVSTDMQMPGSA